MILQAVPTLSQQGAWVLSGQTLDASGHPSQVAVIPACQGSNFAACEASLTKFHLQELINYQPISRFWELPVGRDRDLPGLRLGARGVLYLVAHPPRRLTYPGRSRRSQAAGPVWPTRSWPKLW